MQSLYQPQQFLYICRISAAVDHVSIEEDYVRRLFLYLCNQAGVLPAKRFPVKVGEEDQPKRATEILQGDGIGCSANSNVRKDNKEHNN